MDSEFKKLMYARFFLTLGAQVQVIILGWHMYVLTKNPLYLGLIGLSEAVPALGLALHAGLIVDRKSPLTVFRFVALSTFFSGLVLLLSQSPWLELGPSWEIGALFLSSIITGFARAFAQPSVYAIVPRLIPRDKIQTSSAWMSSTLQIARIGGPALGGILYGLIGVFNTSIVLVAILTIAVWFCFRIEIQFPGHGTLSHEPVGRALTAGLNFVLKHPILLPALTLDMVAVLFGGVTALLPVFAAEILHIDSLGLGVLRAAPAAGAAIISIFLTRLDLRSHAGPWLLSAITGFGLSILVFSLSQSYFLSLGALFMSGAFDSISMVIRTAAVQLLSPDSMRGRISSVNTIFISSSNELGEFESGLAAKLMGTVPASIFGGIICLSSVLAAAIFCPTLRKLNLAKMENV